MSDSIAAQKEPYSVKLEAGKNYAWCACGRSKDQPYCDGSHKETGLSPVFFKTEEGREAWLCGCKQTKNKPYCDGSHTAL
ncbi:MAG: CDGSH iron-sulfur domain-containing protein [Alphaproteobacteria bacterium]|nr:CDGSH iron-sulfur domain-containing protein [Alphaproteobacteria bacterium]